jgi:hypothetical protein
VFRLTVLNQRRHVRGRSLVAVIVLFGMMSQVGCGTGAGVERSAKANPAVTTAGPKTGDLFPRGRLMNGKVWLAKARVWISLSPVDDDTKIGEQVPLWESKKAKTDAKGRYLIRVDPDELPSKFFDAENQFLNFDLHFVANRTFGTTSATLWLLDDPQVWRTEGARRGDAVLALSFDIENGTLTTTDSTGETTRSKFLLNPGAEESTQPSG